MMKKLSYEYVKNQIENTTVKLEYSYIKSQIEKEEGYKLLSKEYINSKTKLLVECLKGHKYWVTWNNFQQGYRCPNCAGTKKLIYDYIKQEFENEEYKLLSKIYKNVHNILKVECPEGHQYEVTYGNFQQGIRCPVCAGLKKLTYEFVKEQFEIEGYELLSKTYKSVVIKLKTKCPEGHIYKVNYNNFQQGRRCSICYELQSYSKSEKDCLHVVKQITPNEVIIENDRTQIMNPKSERYLELDIWMPELKKAIEFNGEYWHDNDYSRYKDDQKIEQCKEKNIDLLVVNYKDWINNRKNEIDKMKIFLGEINVKI